MATQLHPVQAAFIAHDGFQCGFCTPGQIMSAIGLIQEGAGRRRPRARPRRHERQSLPLRRLCGHHRSGARSAERRSPQPTGEARRMNRFDYVRPATVAEAVAAAAVPGAAYLAAGTNLLDLMKGGVVRPDRLVDVTPLPGLDRIEPLPDGGVRIGALVRNADLAHDRAFRAAPIRPSPKRCCPARRRSCATPRPSAAICCSGTRCAYFYDPASACNKREPGTGCDARNGENRLHAVLGWSEPCIATHPSDFCVPLVALDAVVEIEGQRGRREIALEDLHRLPGDTPERETVLEPGDLIVALRLPAEARALRGACALSESSRAHLLCLRGRLCRRGAAASRTARSRGAHRARRRRAQALARARGRGGAGRRAPDAAASGAPRRRRSPTPSPPATTPSRSSWRGGSSCAR